MKIAVSAEGTDLEAALGMNFGRCAYYLLVDVDTLAYEAMSNPSATARGGAGSEAARAVAERSVEAVITGLIGPNAYVALREAGVPVFSAPAGTVRAAVQAFRAAHLAPLAGPNAAPHAPFSRQGLTHANPAGRASGRGRRQPPRSVEAEGEIQSLHRRVQALEEELASLREYVKPTAKRTREQS